MVIELNGGMLIAGATVFVFGGVLGHMMGSAQIRRRTSVERKRWKQQQSRHEQKIRDEEHARYQAELDRRKEWGQQYGKKRQEEQQRREEKIKEELERKYKREKFTVETVAQCNTYTQNDLLNKKERPVYWALVGLLGKSGQYRICPQASLGEFIYSSEELCRRAINSKRCDFLIADKTFSPRAVVEFQGEGHWQGDWEERDEIKRLACEKVGINYIEIFPCETGDKLQQHIEEQLKAHGLLETVSSVTVPIRSCGR